MFFFYSVLRRWVKNDEAVENGTQGGTCLAFSLSMSLCNPNKYPQTHRGTELARLMRRNKTVPSAENRTKEGKKPAVLIGIPSSWSSWIQTLPHSQLTQRNRKKAREEDERRGGGGARATGSTSLIVVRTLTQHLLCIPQLPMWLLAGLQKPFFGGQTPKQS